MKKSKYIESDEDDDMSGDNIDIDKMCGRGIRSSSSDSDSSCSDSGSSCSDSDSNSDDGCDNNTTTNGKRNNVAKNIDKRTILEELDSHQLKNVHRERKLRFKDLRRITKYINTSIFDKHNCCMWGGYVTNESNSKRGTYVNFFFRNKKVALHRLLYENFVGELGDESYIKFNCEDMNHNGKCCNIQHMVKYKYNIADAKTPEPADSPMDDAPAQQKKKIIKRADNEVENHKKQPVPAVKPAPKPAAPKELKPKIAKKCTKNNKEPASNNMPPTDLKLTFD